MNRTYNKNNYNIKNIRKINSYNSIHYITNSDNNDKNNDNRNSIRNNKNKNINSSNRNSNNKNNNINTNNINNQNNQITNNNNPRFGIGIPPVFLFDGVPAIDLYGYDIFFIEHVIQDAVHPIITNDVFSTSIMRLDFKSFNARISYIYQDDELEVNVLKRKFLGRSFYSLPLIDSINKYSQQYNTNPNGVYIIRATDNDGNLLIRTRIFRVDSEFNIMLNNIVLSEDSNNVIRYKTDARNNYFITPMIFKSNYQSLEDLLDRNVVSITCENGDVVNTKITVIQNKVQEVYRIIDPPSSFPKDPIIVRYVTIGYEDIKLSSPATSITYLGIRTYKLSKESSINIDNVRYKTELTYHNLGSIQQNDRYKLTIVETDQKRHIRFRVNFKNNSAQVSCSVEVIFGNTEDNTGTLNADLQTVDKGDSFVETSLVDLDLLEREIDDSLYPNFDTSKMTLEIFNNNDTNEKVIYNFDLVEATKVNPESSDTYVSSM